MCIMYWNLPDPTCELHCYMQSYKWPLNWPQANTLYLSILKAAAASNCLSGWSTQPSAGSDTIFVHRQFSPLKCHNKCVKICIFKYYSWVSRYIGAGHWINYEPLWILSLKSRICASFRHSRAPFKELGNGVSLHTQSHNILIYCQTANVPGS